YAVHFVDTRGRVISWNEGATRLFGHRTEQILGKPLSTFDLPDDIAHGLGQRELDSATCQGRAQTERWQVRRDGTRFWARITTTPVRSAETGGISGFTRIVRDDSERKSVLDELRASEETFAGIVAIAGEAIVAIDEDQRVVVFNQEAERIFGYASAE